MFYYLSVLNEEWGPFRLFQYVSFRAGGAAATAFLLSVLLGPLTVRWLKHFRATAPARLEGLVPQELIDRAKDKTPSMGGILIIASIVVATLLWAVPTNHLLPTFLGTTVSLSALGFLDDFAKVAYRRRDGIDSHTKLMFQFTIAIAAVMSLYAAPETGSYIWELMVPLVKAPVLTGVLAMPILVFVLAVFVVVGASNAVNLTDGKDGLAIGSTIFCTLTYAVFAYICGHKVFAEYLLVPFIPGSSEVVVFAAAIVGSGIGFLWWNCHPASMFMGDTGSLALGGAIGLIAVLVRQELLLLLVGGVFVMEAASVLIQVASFKLFGRRVFLCTPIHHHFERLPKPWAETQIVVRFWILAGIFALMGLATLKLR